MKKIGLSLAALALIFSCSKDTAEENNGILTLEAQQFQVDEHIADGTTIGSVVVSGAQRDEITFTITSNIGIQINETTGELTVGEDTVLDFETQPNITLTVEAFDGTTIADAEITLQINDINEYEALTEEQKELIDYFKLLTLWQGPSSSGLDNNTRWEEPMKLYLDGQISNNYRATVEEVIADYNALFVESDFNIALVDTEAASNAHLYFGPKAEIEGLWADMFEDIETGSFVGYAITFNLSSALSDSRIWISNEIGSLTKHELGHALGFGHSDRCDSEDSFMCSTVNSNSDFLDIEKEIIRLAYHADMEKGLSDEEIDFTLATILLNEE